MIISRITARRNRLEHTKTVYQWHQGDDDDLSKFQRS